MEIVYATDIDSYAIGADITLFWARRTRVGGDLKDAFCTVLLAEDAEQYKLEVPGPMTRSGARSRV